MGKGCCGAEQEGTRKNLRNPGGPGTVTSPHDEEVCHGTNVRRRDLIDQLKLFLNEFDERPCQAAPASQMSAAKPLGQYPEYAKKHCQSWMPPMPRPPLITSVQTHEVRPAADSYHAQRQDNSEYLTYVDVRTKPPPPTCDCVKRNGLQDRCQRPECSPPTARCMATNPGPCCPPSLGLSGTTPGLQPPPPPHTAYSAESGAGLQMACFCKASATDMPSGQKYLCCPVPL